MVRSLQADAARPQADAQVNSAVQQPASQAATIIINIIVIVAITNIINIFTIILITNITSIIIIITITTMLRCSASRFPGELRPHSCDSRVMRCKGNLH